MAVFFTSDFHLGDQTLIEKWCRQFKSASRMTDVLIANANARAKNPEDTIIHVGDFVSYGKDQGIESARISGKEYCKRFTANVILLEGNHDANNHVSPIGKYLVVDIGPYRNVTVGHFPSFYPESMFLQNLHRSIHICGHVHDKWKFMIGKDGILNINVGVDVWKNQIVSIPDLIRLIEGIRK